jgi:hypothetical protein
MIWDMSVTLSTKTRKWVAGLGGLCNTAGIYDLRSSRISSGHPLYVACGYMFLLINFPKYVRNTVHDGRRTPLDLFFGGLVFFGCGLFFPQRRVLRPSCLSYASASLYSSLRDVDFVQLHILSNTCYLFVSTSFFILFCL